MTAPDCSPDSNGDHYAHCEEPCPCLCHAKNILPDAKLFDILEEEGIYERPGL